MQNIKFHTTHFQVIKNSNRTNFGKRHKSGAVSGIGGSFFYGDAKKNSGCFRPPLFKSTAFHCVSLCQKKYCNDKSNQLMLIMVE